MNGEHRKNIKKYIELAGRVHSPWTVFNDFLTTAAITIANNCDPYNTFTSEEVRDAREKRYLSVVEKYDKREQRFLTSMFAELVNELQTGFVDGKPPRFVDVLGELFHEMDFGNKWKGQFFTPQHVANLMAEMIIGDGEECRAKLTERSYFTINEPCCGGGAMIYGATNAMVKAGLNPGKDALVIANDIDERCVFMTYIQCSLYGIPAIVQQKNSLTDEVIGDAWYTPLFVLNGWRYVSRNDVG